MSLEITSAALFRQGLKHIYQTGEPMIVKLYFTWCGHCQKIEEPFEMLAEQFPHVHFVSINMEKFPDIAQIMKVNAGPTFVVFNQGKIVDRIEGANLNAIVTTLQQLW